MNPIEDTNIIIFFDEFYKRLNSNSIFYKKKDNLFISKLLNSDHGILRTAFGDIGDKIVAFLKSVDISHPNIEDCYDGIFQDDGEFHQVFDELCSYSNFGKANKFTKLSELLQSFMSKYILDNFKILSKIDVPENNRCNLRFLNDSEKKEKIRCQKKMQIIDLNSAYKKGIYNLNSHPNNFYNFLRFDKSLENEVKNMERKAKRYEDLGCSFLANEITNNLKSYHEYIRQSYFGFNRITMSTASLILSRNFNYTNSITPTIFSGQSDIFKIFATQGNFGKYFFDENEEINGYEYEPKIYPLNYFNDILTDKVKDVISKLESFPEADNKSIFDFYGLIVPSFNFPVLSKDKNYSFIDCNGRLRVYQDCLESKYEFDKNMIQNKYFNPIIVAEKDHKCYFITYWI